MSKKQPYQDDDRYGGSPSRLSDSQPRMDIISKRRDTFNGDLSSPSHMPPLSMSPHNLPPLVQSPMRGPASKRRLSKLDQSPNQHMGRLNLAIHSGVN